MARSREYTVNEEALTALSGYDMQDEAETPLSEPEKRMLFDDWAIEKAHYLMTEMGGRTLLMVYAFQDECYAKGNLFLPKSQFDDLYKEFCSRPIPGKKSR